ncbi:PqqD family protein [Acidobacteriota bacterium]
MADKETLHYQQSGQAKLKKVGSDMAVYVKEQKAIHVLNQTAYLLFELMKEPVSFDEMVIVVQEATNADEKTVRQDLKETIKQFLKHKIIQIVK